MKTITLTVPDEVDERRLKRLLPIFIDLLEFDEALDKLGKILRGEDIRKVEAEVKRRLWKRYSSLI